MKGRNITNIEETNQQITIVFTLPKLSATYVKIIAPKIANTYINY